MPTNLEDLILRIDVDSRRLRRELRRVQDQNRTASRAVGRQWAAASTGLAASAKSLARFTGVGAAVTGALSAVSLVSQTREALEYADSIDKTADRLGLSTDALQEFRFAADQSGVATRTLDLAIQRFTRRSGEAANGTGEARDAIAELGLELRDSEGQIRRTEDLFSDAIEALGEVDVPAERLRLAFKLFDSEGVAVLQMVENFEALRAKALELGVVLDRQTIERAVEAKDELAAMSQIVRAQLTPSLVGLAQAILPVADAFARVSTFASTFFDSLRDADAIGEQGLVRQLGIVGATVRRLTDQIDELESLPSRSRRRQVLPGLREELESASVRFEELQAQLRELRAEAESGGQLPLNATQVAAVRGAIEELGVEYTRLLRISAEGVRGNEEAIRRIQATYDASARAEQLGVAPGSDDFAEISSLTLAIANVTAESERYAAAQANVNQIIEASRSPLEVLNDGIRRLQEDAAAGRIEAVQLEQGIDALNDQFQETQKGLRDGVQDFEETFKGLNRALVSNFSRSMADMLFTGELTFQALAQSFARDFVAATIQTTLLNAFFAPAQAGGGGVFGQVFSLGGARAMGGPVRGGVPYLVGERGPEIIVPRGPGFVQPSSAVHGARTAPPTVAATPVVVRIINNSGSDAQVAERRGPAGQREIDVMIEDSVRRNIASGGSIAQAIHATTGTRPRGA